MKWRTKREKGQSIVEFAIILPFFLLLIIGLVETAFALRSYLYVNTACREGIRFAARGRYTDEDTARWMLASGGFTTLNGQQVPFFRTEDPDPNTGVIITHIPIRADGTFGEGRTYAVGFIYNQSGQTLEPITFNHSRADEVDVERHRMETIEINNQRAAEGYERLDNQLVIVEVFYAHHTIWNYQPLGLPQVIPMYSRAVMRVVSDSRQSQ